MARVSFFYASSQPDGMSAGAYDNSGGSRSDNPYCFYIGVYFYNVFRPLLEADPVITAGYVSEAPISTGLVGVHFALYPKSALRRAPEVCFGSTTEFPTFDIRYSGGGSGAAGGGTILTANLAYIGGVPWA
jgi:hypothetical protein